MGKIFVRMIIVPSPFLSLRGVICGIFDTNLQNTQFMIKIYTDGACSGNPGVGAWAALVVNSNGERHAISGAFKSTTNNRMELVAVIMALQMTNEGEVVDLYSDSQYIVSAFEKGWITNWVRRGWKTAQKKPVANRDLWEKLIELANKRKFSPIWVRGHDGHVENELCDQMAREAILKGPFEIDKGYQVDNTPF